MADYRTRSVIRCRWCRVEIIGCRGKHGDWMHVPPGQRSGPERCVDGRLAEPKEVDDGR